MNKYINQKIRIFMNKEDIMKTNMEKRSLTVIYHKLKRVSIKENQLQ